MREEVGGIIGRTFNTAPEPFQAQTNNKFNLLCHPHCSFSSYPLIIIFSLNYLLLTAALASKGKAFLPSTENLWQI